MTTRQTPPITFNEYVISVNGALRIQRSDPPETQWRRGQTYFNVLHQIRPDLASRVRATRLDPFHDDRRVPEFLSWVNLHWGHKEEGENGEA